jgi:hypothetical protein
MSPAFLEAFWKAPVSDCSRSVGQTVTHVHSVLAGGLFASVALGKRPEERVGERILAEIGKHLILDLESGELSCFVLEGGISCPSCRLTRVGNGLLGESL